MDEIFDVGETILLDGEPLSPVTCAGIKAWIEKGVQHSYRYDQLRDPLYGKLKYRCLYEAEGADMPYVLVSDRGSEHGALVILFDEKPNIGARP